MAWDPARDVASSLGVRDLPALVLLGTDGKVLLRQSWLSPTLREATEELVGGSSASRPSQTTGTAIY